MTKLARVMIIVPNVCSRFIRIKMYVGSVVRFRLYDTRQLRYNQGTRLSV